MAVPKKKRYTQVVRTRRSLQETILLKKYGWSKEHYKNFFEKTNFTNSTKNCWYCNGGQKSTLCLNCYKDLLL